MYRPATWEGVLAAVEETRHVLGFDEREESFLRGHADHNWELLPTLHRRARELRLCGDETHAVEGALFWEFQARAQELHGENLSDWDYLFFMRHHGVVTRLLDWSESFGVALHFALERHRDGLRASNSTPCIWVLNPYALNETDRAWGARDLVSPRYLGYIAKEDETYDYGDLLDHKGFRWKSPVAIYPVQRSNRVRAQRGWFTIQGADERPLEQQAPRAVAQVLIPEVAVKEGLKFLERAGLNEYTIYADLDHLANELHRKNGLA